MPTSSKPRRIDRLWDAAALFLVLGGVALFIGARRALTSIGDGTYAFAPGISAVVQADFHVARSRLAIWTIGLGLLLGLAAAARHRLRRDA